MFEEVLSWGLEPLLVTGDSWYSSLENLKFLKEKKDILLERKKLMIRLLLLAIAVVRTAEENLFCQGEFEDFNLTQEIYWE